MRRGAKIGIVGGVFTALVSVAGVGAYNLYEGLTGGSTGTDPVAQALPTETGPPTATEVRDTARKFLAAWAKGNVSAAGALTNNPATARSALTEYRTQARVTSVKLTPGPARGTTVPFTVDATLSYGGKKSPWSYSSSLTVFRGKTTHKPLVDWQPSVLNPKLTQGQAPVTGEAKSPPVDVVDRSGRKLDAAD
jgi:NTF2-like N-terminal transpeptidase domain